MEKELIFNYLRRIELFKTLDDVAMETISRHIIEKSYPAGSLLFSENNPQEELLFIVNGRIRVFRKTPYGEEKTISSFGVCDFLGEGCIVDDSPHACSARAIEDTTVLSLGREQLVKILNDTPSVATSVYCTVAKVTTRRMRDANSRFFNAQPRYESGQTRTEHDLLGYREVPCESYYGIQTMRAMENFNISGIPLSFFPVFIDALASVKMAAAAANHELGLLEEPIKNAIEKACDDVKNQKLNPYFVVDMIQGGAGTSTNMNANEVIANRALEIMGHERGDYKHCHPNNHVNLSQSTNDAYPTAVNIALTNANKGLIEVLGKLILALREKSREFATILKMGRTQLQDAVPMTLGQSFEAYAVTFEEEVDRLSDNANLFLEVNMGATAIGTGINTDPLYAKTVVKHLRHATGLDLKLAPNLVEATQDTGRFIMYSSAIKRLAVKLSKICNDLRLLSSGPRAGFNEINLPKLQPGSSIMPGKVNPVIPEVVNQIAFKVIGNDLTVTLAVEAGQLELNVMEPIIVQSIFESIEVLKNGMTVLTDKCITEITANAEHTKKIVFNSIGLVTALNPILGYETSTQLAKEALEQDKGVYELVLEKNLLSKDRLDDILSPDKMIKPHKIYKQSV